MTVLIVAGCGVDAAEGPTRPTEVSLESAGPEPTTGAPVMPNAGSESVVKDPFAPYSIGPPEAAWSYEQLTADERVVADRGRKTTGWAATHSAYRTAAMERSAEARASAAARQLGVAQLDAIGVVP